MSAGSTDGMTERSPTRIAVLGLGEAGSLIAADLARSGARVSAYDPAGVSTPDDVTRVEEPEEAVVGAHLVMAITPASASQEVMSATVHAIEPPTVYADLATAAPGLEVALASTAAEKGLPFADVALMAPVPGHGLAVPSLASGSGAARYEEMVNALGGDVVAIGDAPGHASARKLMRSIVTKGLGALLMESMDLAHAYDDTDWLWQHLVAELGAVDEGFMKRLLEGPARHAGRRLEEMEAVAELLADQGLDASMTQAVIERLGMVLADGLPEHLARR